MNETIAQVLARLADRPERFDELKSLLADRSFRQQLLDYTDEITREISNRYSAAIDDRTSFYAELLQREGQNLEGHGQLDAIKILDHELDSILEAADRALDQEFEGELLLPFAKYLVEIMERTGRWNEARSLYERIVERTRSYGDPTSLSRVLSSFGILLFQLGEFNVAEPVLTESKQIAETLGDEKLIANATSALGNVYIMTENFERAIELQQSCLKLRRKLGQLQPISSTLTNLATIYCKTERFEQARELYSESLEIDRKTGDIQGMAITLLNMGNVYNMQGRIEEAYPYYEQSETIFREAGDRHGMAMLLGNLGVLDFQKGDLAKAEKMLSESLEIYKQIGDKEGIAVSIGWLGSIAYLREQLEMASRLFEENVAMYREMGRKDCDIGVLASLSMAKLDLGEEQVAYSHLKTALKSAKEREWVGSGCDVLAAASIFLVTHEMPRAAAIIAFGALQQVKALKLRPFALRDQWTGHTRGECLKVLTPEEFQSCQTDGESMDYKQLVEFALVALAELQTGTSAS